MLSSELDELKLKDHKLETHQNKLNITIKAIQEMAEVSTKKISSVESEMMDNRRVIHEL